MEDRVLVELRKSCYDAVLPGVRVGMDDSFFDLGGDSLQLIRLVAVTQDVFDVDVDAAGFFSEPTLARLAAEVRTELQPQAVPDL